MQIDPKIFRAYDIRGVYPTQITKELAYKIGQAYVDVTLANIAKSTDLIGYEPKISIRTGYGIEYILTDALSRRIIENVITPQFKQGNFFKGLDDGTTSIIRVMNGEYQGEPQYSDESGGIPLVFIFFLCLEVILLKG